MQVVSAPQNDAQGTKREWRITNAGLSGKNSNASTLEALNTLFPFSGLLSSVLNELTTPGAQARTLRERAEKDEEDRERRTSERTKTAEGANIAGLPPAPMETIKEDERNLTASSQAGRRQQMDRNERQAAQRAQDLRGDPAQQQTLQETAARQENNPVVLKSGEPAATPVDGESVGVSSAPQPNAGKHSSGFGSGTPDQTKASSPVSQTGAADAPLRVTPPAFSPVMRQAGENPNMNAVAPNVTAAVSAGTNRNDTGTGQGARPAAGAVQGVSEVADSPPALQETNAKDVPGVLAAKPAAGDGRAVGNGIAAMTDGKNSAAARTAAKPAAGADSAVTGDSDANIERIVRVVSGRLGKERSSTILRLDPPMLGSVRLHLDLRDSALQLRIDTQTDVAHRLLSEQMDSLRQNLEAAGVHLERVEVRPPEPASGPFDANTPQDPGSQQPGHEGSAGASAEHSRNPGKEAAHAEPADTGLRGSNWTTVTESRVNVWA